MLRYSLSVGVLLIYFASAQAQPITYQKFYHGNDFRQDCYICTYRGWLWAVNERGEATALILTGQFPNSGTSSSTIVHAFDWKNGYLLTTDWLTGNSMSGGWSLGPWDDRYYFNNDKSKNQPYTVTEGNRKFIVNENGDKQLVTWLPDGRCFVQGWNQTATVDASGIHFSKGDHYIRATPIQVKKPVYTITQVELMKLLSDMGLPKTFGAGGFSAEFDSLEDLPGHIQLVEGGIVTRIKWNANGMNGHMRIFVGINVVQGQPVIHSAHAFTVTTSNFGLQLHMSLFGAPHEIRKAIYDELKAREPLLKQMLYERFESLRNQNILYKALLGKADDYDIRFRHDRIEFYKH